MNATQWPALPDRVKLLVAVPTYDGRLSSEVMLYVSGLWQKAMDACPRLEGVAVVTESGYPTDRVRNTILAKALNSGFDFVLMIDDDMHPDVGVGSDPEAVPFLPAALNFAVAHDGPCFVGAPYTSAPPRQRVLVMRWAERVPDSPDGLGLELRSYTREEAATLTGIERVAALPTGMLLIDLRAVKTHPTPWFSYEFEDEAHTKLASTEDIVFTRDADWMGVPQYCAFSSWAGHQKKYTTGRPRIAPVEALPKAVHKALNSGRWKPPALEV
jgi:hypothetical protein